MATSVTFNNNTYSIPANREPRGWGTSLSAFLIDVANSSLSKAGGNFTLTADINFGADYGLVSKYFKSYSSDISKTGIVRLANNEGIGWRDSTNADGQDKVLKVSTGDRLQFDSVNIPTVSSTDTLTNKTLTSPVINSPTGIVKGDVGLGNVDNTSDANKPVSTATQTALNLKADATSGTITTPVFNSFTDYAFIASPAAPVSGVRVYGKSDGKLYKTDSASGIESAIGGGLAPEPKSANFTAVAGKHYLCNTTSGAITVTLPTGAAEAAIKFSDASETWDSYAVTITPASGQKIDNLATNESLVCDVKRGWVELSWNTALSSWSLQSLAATDVVAASATQAGVVTTGAQTFAGVKTFQDAPVISNASGIVAASATVPGVVTTGAQTLAGTKTFTDGVVVQSGSLEVGLARAADGSSYIDLTSQSGAIDYNARIIRSSGANGTLRIEQKGTADIEFVNNSGTAAFKISQAGNITAAQNITLGTNCAVEVSSGALRSNSIYNFTTGAAANVAIDVNGYLQRSTSSLKYKKDVQDSIHGLDSLLQLRTVTYKSKNPNDNDKVFGGLIAEEVHAIGLEEFVQYAADGSPDALAYGNMVALCIKAIQELSAKVDAQAAQLARLLPPVQPVVETVEPQPEPVVEQPPTDQ